MQRTLWIVEHKIMYGGLSYTTTKSSFGSTTQSQSHSHSLYDGQLLFSHADFGVQDLRRIGVNITSGSMSIARDSMGRTENSPAYSPLK